MSKLPYKTLLIILAFLLIPIILLIQANRKAGLVEAGWFDEGWHYRRAVSINNNSAFNGSNVPYKYTFDTSTLISAGKMQASGNDIRVVDQNGKVVRHQVELSTLNTTTTGLWFEASIPSKTAAIYYVYYGNSSASALTFNSDVESDDGGTTVEMNDGFGYTTDTTNARVSDIRLNDNNLGVNGNYHYTSVGYPGNWWDDRAFTKTALASGPLFSEVKYEDTNYGNYSSLGTNIKMFANGFVEVRLFMNYNTDTNELLYYYLHFDNGTRNSLWVNSSETLVDQANDSEILYEANLHDNWFGQRWTDTGNYGGTIITKNGSDWYNGYTSAQASYYQVNNTYTEAYTNGTSREIRYGIFAGNGSSSDMNQKASLLGDYTVNAAAEEISKAPVAYWSFDEGYGNVVHDSSSNQNNGSFGTGSSAPAWQTENMCISGKCLYFKGDSTSSIDTNYDYSLSYDSSTSFSFWFKPITSNTGGKIKNLLSKNSYEYMLAQEDQFLRFIQWTSAGGNALEFTTSNFIQANTWYFVSFIYDGSQHKGFIYINGKLNQSASATSSDFINRTESLKIGTGYGWSSSTSPYFNGFMDEVKIYPYARSAAEIKSDYNAGKSGASSSKGTSASLGGSSLTDSLSNGLVGYWKMDEASWNGTVNEVIDSSGNGNHGQGVGSTVPTTSAGKFGNGGVFPQTNSTYVLGGSNGFSNNAGTINFWIKPDWNGNDNTEHNFITVGAPGSNGLLFRKVSSGNYLNFETYNSTDCVVGFGYCDLDYSIADWIAGDWHLLTISWDNTGKNLFVDGKLVDSSTNNIFSSTSTGIYIGSRNGTSSANATLDEVRIYNRVLSPAEVSDLYEWAPGPVAYYNFDEGVGTTAFDTSGNSNNGVWSGTGTHWDTGKYGKAGKFNGSDDWIQISNNNSLDVKTITLSAWVYPKSCSVDSHIIRKEGSYILSSCWTGNAYLWMSIDGGGWTGLNSNTALPLNSWSYISATYDGSTRKIYVNGVLKNSSSLSGSITTTAATVDLNGTVSNSEYGEYLSDEVKIYNYARTQKQIISDMNAGHPAVGSPIGSALVHYKLDEGYGTTANNSGGLGSTLNATLYNSTSWSNNGKFGKALDFSGGVSSGDYITLGSSYQIDLTSATVSFWAKRDVLTTTQDATNITGSLRILYGTTSYRFLDQLVDDTYFQFNGERDVNSEYWARITSNVEADTNWHHFVITANQNVFKLYIDGKYQGTDDDSSAGYTSNICTIGSIARGYGNAHSSYGSYYDGLIDEVKIYNYALTEDEVKQDYNQGKTMVMGQSTSDSGSTAPGGSSSQEYCVPGSTDPCSPPVAEWNFEKGIGSSAFDTSGNGNNGVISGAIWSTGKIGKSLKFNGSTDNVQAVSGDGGFGDFAGSNFSIEAWVKTTDGDGTIADSGPGGAGDYWRMGTTGEKAFFAINPGGATNPTLVSTDNYNNNKWHYIVGVRDGVRNIKLYVDGTLLGDQDVGGASSTVDAHTNVFIGQQQNGTYGLDGLIDQVRVYNYARTSSQIAWDYNLGKPVAHYKMDECQGTVIHSTNDVYDSTLNGTLSIGVSGTQTSAGTCTSSGAWANGSTGKYSSAMSFDGSDDYINVGSNIDDFSFQKTDPFSVTAWINPNSGMANYSGIVQNQDGSTYNGWNLSIYADDGLSAVLATTGADKYFITRSNGLNLNSWNHVTLTYDGSSDASGMKLYINGVEKSVSIADNDCGASISYGSANTEIGRRAYSALYFDGLIDDVQIYNYALTSDQVKTLYNNGAVSFN